MDTSHRLKYLPIPLMFTLEEVVGTQARQFTEEIPACMMVDSYERFNSLQRYIRKLQLKIQRIYRDEIRFSGKDISEFYLKVFSDFTIVERPDNWDYPYFVYCILELCEKEKWMSTEKTSSQ